MWARPSWSRSNWTASWWFGPAATKVRRRGGPDERSRSAEADDGDIDWRYYRPRLDKPADPVDQLQGPAAAHSLAPADAAESAIARIRAGARATPPAPAPDDEWDMEMIAALLVLVDD